jgi:hypothetical protein
MLLQGTSFLDCSRPISHINDGLKASTLGCSLAIIEGTDLMKLYTVHNPCTSRIVEQCCVVYRVFTSRLSPYMHFIDCRSTFLFHCFLGASAKLRKAIICFVISVCLPACLSVCLPACLSVCLSVCPFVHPSVSPLPPEGFWWNLTLWLFRKICREILKF